MFQNHHNSNRCTLVNLNLHCASVLFIKAELWHDQLAVGRPEISKSSAFLKSGDLEEKMLEKFVLEGCENLVFFPEDSTWKRITCNLCELILSVFLSERNLKTANARMAFYLWVERSPK